VPTTTTTFNPTADTYVDSKFGSKNYAFRANQAQSTSWTGTGLTWNNATAPGVALGSSGAISANAYASADVAAAVTTRGVIGLVVTDPATTGTTFQSREATNRPQLVVTTTPPSDTTAPSVPTGLTATAAGGSQINVSWTASTDNTAVHAYRLYRGETFLATVGGTSYADTGLTGGTSYSYTVSAIDGAGNESAASSAAAATAVAVALATIDYAYDLADRLTGLSQAGSSPITFGLDALGRHASRSVGGTLADTYAYLGESLLVSRISRPGVTIDAAIDPLGSRLATATSTGGFGWSLANLRGDTAAVLDATGATISDAFRYDPYGELIASVTGPLPTPWRFQGRLLETGPGDADHYDFGARSYAPDLAAFTSLDSIAGGAQNPITLNRYLYANADPETLIDPDGHAGIDPFEAFGAVLGGLGEAGRNTVAFGQGFLEGGAGAVVGSVEGLGALAGGTIDAASCALDGACRDAAVASAGQLAQSVAADPGLVGQAAGSLLGGVGSAVRGAVGGVTGAWGTGNFRALGQMTGAAVTTVATSAIPVGAVVKVGAATRAAAAARSATATAKIEQAATVAQRAAATRSRVEAAIAQSRAARQASRFEDPLTGNAHVPGATRRGGETQAAARGRAEHRDLANRAVSSTRALACRMHWQRFSRRSRLLRRFRKQSCTEQRGR